MFNLLSGMYSPAPGVGSGGGGGTGGVTDYDDLTGKPKINNQQLNSAGLFVIDLYDDQTGANKSVDGANRQLLYPGNVPIADWSVGFLKITPVFTNTSGLFDDAAITIDGTFGDYWPAQIKFLADGMGDFRMTTSWLGFVMKSFDNSIENAIEFQNVNDMPLLTLQNSGRLILNGDLDMNSYRALSVDGIIFTGGGGWGINMNGGSIQSPGVINLRNSGYIDGATSIGTQDLYASGSSVMFVGLPTTDPVYYGRLWNDNGTVKISNGL